MKDFQMKNELKELVYTYNSTAGMTHQGAGQGLLEECKENLRRENISEEHQAVMAWGAHLLLTRMMRDEEEHARLSILALEAERAEAARIEAERVEAERIEAERVEAERVEAERVEAERVEAERVEAERARMHAADEAMRLHDEAEAAREAAEQAETQRQLDEVKRALLDDAERAEAEKILAETEGPHPSAGKGGG